MKTYATCGADLVEWLDPDGTLRDAGLLQADPDHDGNGAPVWLLDMTEPFQLDATPAPMPPAKRPKPHATHKQGQLFAGLDLLPGQTSFTD